MSKVMTEVLDTSEVIDNFQNNGYVATSTSQNTISIQLLNAI